MIKEWHQPFQKKSWIGGLVKKTQEQISYNIRRAKSKYGSLGYAENGQGRIYSDSITYKADSSRKVNLCSEMGI
jgi:hypothetical protein